MYVRTYQRFSTLVARFSWFCRPLEGEKMSKSAQKSIDLLIIFRCLNSALTGQNPVDHRFVSLRFQGKDFGRIQLLETSIWRCDETTTGKQWLRTAICSVVRPSLQSMASARLTRFKDKVSYVVHIVNISLLSRSFTLRASVNILKFKFYFHIIHCTISCYRSLL